MLEVLAILDKRYSWLDVYFGPRLEGNFESRVRIEYRSRTMRIINLKYELADLCLRSNLSQLTRKSRYTPF